MAFMTISQHSQLPICEAKVVKRIKPSKEWVLRYQMDDVVEDQGPIALLDERMGKLCKAPGVYAAKFETVYDAWREVLRSAPPAPEVDQVESKVKETPQTHSGPFVIVALLLVMAISIVARIAIIPFYLAIAILSGGSPTVIASIAMMDGWLQFKGTQRLINNLGKAF